MAQVESIHKHAFWLYGVIIGLAIKSALESTIPHIIEPHDPPLDFIPDLARLIIFLTLVIRFYLGSAIYFGDVYEGTDANLRYREKNYALDFLFGFMHFLAFFLLAFSIDVHSKPVMLFPSLLTFVLLYDFLWWIFCRKYDASGMIAVWMGVNLISLLCGALAYFISRYAGANEVRAELYAFIPIMFFSAVDLADMVLPTPIYENVLAKFTRNQPSTNLPPVPPTDSPPTP